MKLSFTCFDCFESSRTIPVFAKFLFYLISTFPKLTMLTKTDKRFKRLCY